MTDTKPDVCGSTDTTSGEPCQFSPAESCPYHYTDDPPDNGRPSKLTDDRISEAIQAAREGKSQAGCARAAGVDEKTIRNWLDRDEDFFRDFTRARAEGESQVMQDGLYGEADPSMAKFLLASSFGYVKTERRDHDGDVDLGGEVIVDFENTDT